MRSRAFVTIVIVLLALLIGSCSREQGPSKADLESSLAAQLPRFVSLRSFTIEASDNVGDKVDPIYKTRFRAKLQVTEATFTEDIAQGDVLLLTPVKKLGDTIDIFGKSESKLRSGHWETNTTLDESPFADIGQPLSAFSASKILINGTAEEKTYRAEQERIAEATRQATMAKQDFIRKALRGGKPLNGQVYCEYTTKVSLLIDSFDEASDEFTGMFQTEGEEAAPIAGYLKGTSVYFKDTPGLLQCSFSLSLDEVMLILTGRVSCGATINCQLDLSLPRENPTPTAAGGFRVIDTETFQMPQVVFLSMSPDGQWLLATKEQNLCLIQVHPLQEKWCVSWSERIYRPGVSWSSDSQRVAFSEDGPLLFNDSDIWVLELGNRQLTNLTDDGVAGSPPGLFEGTWKTPFDLVPAWSPDGQHIVFSRILNDSTALYTVPTHGGEAVKLTDLPGAAKFAVTYPIFWSQDGRQIIFSLTNPALHDPVNGVYVVDSDGRNLHRVLSTADANQMAIVTGLSASGTLALIWNSTAGIQPGSAAFDLLDLTTGKATPLARPRPGPGVPQDLGNATFSPDGSHLLMAFGGSDAKGELMIRRLDSEIEYSLGTGMDVVRLDINDYYPLQWSQSNRIFASKARGLATVYMLGQ